MLTIEQYGSMYLEMASNQGLPDQQKHICEKNGVTMDQWHEAHTHYFAKMSDPSDMGRTAMTLQGIWTKASQPAPVDTSPADLTATEIRISVNENQVQMVEFENDKKFVDLQMATHEDPNDDFEKTYVKGRVHISINEGKYNIYGGVSSVELYRNKIVFQFDAEGKERMKCDSVTVSFDISNAKFRFLERTLNYMYRNHPVFRIIETVTQMNETWNGVEYDLTWDSFALNENFKVQIRPNLSHLPALRRYTQEVQITCKNEGVSDELYADFVRNITAVFEADYQTIVAMITHDHEIRRMFLYTQLPQDKFMKNVNDALCYLPVLPLNFGGGELPDWNNYMECRKDYFNKKA